MIDRRQILTVGGLLGALAPGGGPDDGVAAGVAQMSDKNVQELVSALKGISTAIIAAAELRRHHADSNESARFLRANAKFPDFIDVSLDVWMGAYDWHVRLQQPLVLGRDVNGTLHVDAGLHGARPAAGTLPDFISIAVRQLVSVTR